MAYPTKTDLGTNVQTFMDVTDAGAAQGNFAEFNQRVPTNCLKRYTMNFYLPAATTAASPYSVGIVPFTGYLVSCKHMCKTVTSAATVEVISGANSDLMTAQSAATSVSTATLGTTAANKLMTQNDIITIAIATGSGALVDLVVEIVIEPLW